MKTLSYVLADLVMDEVEVVEINRVLSNEINHLPTYFPSLNSIIPVPGQCILVIHFLGFGCNSLIF